MTEQANIAVKRTRAEIVQEIAQKLNELVRLNSGGAVANTLTPCIPPSAVKLRPEQIRLIRKRSAEIKALCDRLNIANESLPTDEELKVLTLNDLIKPNATPSDTIPCPLSYEEDIQEAIYLFHIVATEEIKQQQQQFLVDELNILCAAYLKYLESKPVNRETSKISKITQMHKLADILASTDNDNQKKLDLFKNELYAIETSDNSLSAANNSWGKFLRLLYVICTGGLGLLHIGKNRVNEFQQITRINTCTQWQAICTESHGDVFVNATRTLLAPNTASTTPATKSQISSPKFI